MKRNKVYWVLALSLVCLLRMNAEGIDTRIWGEWKLESVEQTIINAEKADKKSTVYSLQSIIKEKITLEDVFLTIYTFDNNIGVCTTSSTYPFNLNINDKGTFITKDNHLVITMVRDVDMVFDFVYKIEDDKLILTIDLPSMANDTVKYRRKMIYNLVGKN